MFPILFFGEHNNVCAESSSTDDSPTRDHVARQRLSYPEVNVSVSRVVESMDGQIRVSQLQQSIGTVPIHPGRSLLQSYLEAKAVA